MFRGGIQPIYLSRAKHHCNFCYKYVHHCKHGFSEHYFPILCEKCKEYIRKNRSDILFYCEMILPIEIIDVILQEYNQYYSGIDNDTECPL